MWTLENSGTSETEFVLDNDSLVRIDMNGTIRGKLFKRVIASCRLNFKK